jgi:glutamyl-tRNA reductase
VSIVLVGLNHHTAPVELREQLSLSGCALTMALDDIRQTSVLNEAVILSTCNRLEIYGVAADAAQGRAFIQNFVTTLQNIPPETMHPHLYFRQDTDAIHHLMRVAAGLDSMILGESQILGQVTQAFTTAQSHGTTGAVLSQLFTKAAHAGKRTRTETEINRYTTSVSHAAALLADGKSGGLKQRNVLVIGAGEMAELAAHAFQKRGVKELAFTNRTYNRAETLARHLGGRAMDWYHLQDALAWADVVVSATSAPHLVLHTADIEKCLAARHNRPLLLIDIAVPRDIEESAGTLPNVQLFDIDDLRSIVDVNMAQRKAAVPQAEAIIEHEQRAFSEWLHSRDVMPVIENLRRRAEAIAQAEIQQALNRLQANNDAEQVITRLAHRLVNKLLHEPTVRLKGFAADGDGYGYAQALADLFALNESKDE